MGSTNMSHIDVMRMVPRQPPAALVVLKIQAVILEPIITVNIFALFADHPRLSHFGAIHDSKWLV